MVRLGLALLAGVLAARAALLHAAPLEKEACDKLKGEQAELEQGGVRGNMGRGPEWAKANLAPDKLAQIKRIIEVDEQILFRCQGRPLVTLREAPETDPAAIGKEGAAKTPVPKVPKAAAGEKGKAPAKKAAVPAGAGNVTPKDVAKPVPKAAPPKAPAVVTPKAGAAKEAPKAPPATKAAPAEASKFEAAKPKAASKSNAPTPSTDFSVNPFADRAPAKK